MARDERTVRDAVADAAALRPAMTGHVLDAPIWHALATRQSDVAIGNAHVLRFAPDFGPLAAIRDHSASSMAALQEIVRRHGAVTLFDDGAFTCPAGLFVTRTGDLVQFVLDYVQPPAGDAHLERLTEDDAGAMHALATKTEPGPFQAQTHRLGAFWGIRDRDRLAAMAGQRTRPPGFVEVSAVCTDPDYRGRGFAAAVTHAVVQDVMAAGDVPFLHCLAQNIGAIAVYRSLGFRERRRFALVGLAASD